MLDLPHFFVKKFLAVIKFFDLKWGKGKNKPELYHGYNIIYVDNKFENFFDQVKIFFESGFFDKEKTVLIFKFYFENYYNILIESKKYNIKILPYIFYRQIPDLTGKVIFYPYNSQSNARLILNRGATHVFLTHGESNKKASVNRMVRLYDYILAAGDFSIERYLESGVFTPYDIAAGRIIRIGDVLIDEYGDFSASHGKDSLIYMPTWEGGLEKENFSSLSNPMLALILIRILNSLNVNNIVIKPHPNTGSRNKKYKNLLKSLCEFLLGEGVCVYMSDACQKKIFGSKYLLSVPGHDVHNLSIVFGVVDISASEFMLASKKIPTIVLAKNVEQCYAPRSYYAVRGKSFFNIDDVKSVNNLNELTYAIKDANLKDVFFEKAFKREVYLKDKKTSEISGFLINYFQEKIACDV